MFCLLKPFVYTFLLSIVLLFSMMPLIETEVQLTGTLAQLDDQSPVIDGITGATDLAEATVGLCVCSQLFCVHLCLFIVLKCAQS